MILPLINRLRVKQGKPKLKGVPVMPGSIGEMISRMRRKSKERISNTQKQEKRSDAEQKLAKQTDQLKKDKERLSKVNQLKVDPTKDEFKDTKKKQQKKKVIKKKNQNKFNKGTINLTSNPGDVNI